MALDDIRRPKDVGFLEPPVHQKFVPIKSGSGTYELIAAVAGKQIQIVSFHFAVNTAGNYVLCTGEDTAQTGKIFEFPMSATGGVFRDSPDVNRPIFAGNIGENVNIQTTANPSAGGVNVQWREM